MTPNDRLLKSFELLLRQHYRAAYLDAQKKVEQYAADLERIDSEMRKALSDEEYAEWRKHKLARLKQYTDMRDVIAQEMTNANVTANQMLNGVLPEVYAEGFNMGVYQLEHDFGLDTSFTLYDRATVTRLIRDDPKLLPDIKTQIPRDLRWNKARLNSDLLRGILNGDSVRDIAKRLPRGSGENNLKGAIRRARTMVNGAENAGRVDSYKRAQDMGIETAQEWLATYDNRTRHSHRQVDGEIVDVGETFSNGCRFPSDPKGRPEEVWNCRCAIRAVLKKYPRTDTEQIRPDGVVKNMTYEEWKEAKPTYGKKHKRNR